MFFEHSRAVLLVADCRSKSLRVHHVSTSCPPDYCPNHPPVPAVALTTNACGGEIRRRKSFYCFGTSRIRGQVCTHPSGPRSHVASMHVAWRDCIRWHRAAWQTCDAARGNRPGVPLASDCLMPAVVKSRSIVRPSGRERNSRTSGISGVNAAGASIYRKTTATSCTKLSISDYPD